MSELCNHEHPQSKIGVKWAEDCPWCKIDRLNKEINKLRQYEDAITSAVDGTLLVWNLMSTNHTVIKNDYWQNHLEEIDRLKAELEEAQELVAKYDDIKDDLQMDKAELQNQLAEAREREAGMTEMYEELYEHHFKEHHTPDYVKIEELENELAEARAEVERLKADLGWARKEKQLVDLQLDQMAVQVQIEREIAEETRQEVARECIEAIETEYGILGLAYTLRQRFGLEG